MGEVAGLALLLAVGAAVMVVALSLVLARDELFPPRHTAGWALGRRLPGDPREAGSPFESWSVDLDDGTSLPVWEIILRGSVIYLSLVLLFRYVIRRDVGAVGVADLLVIVLIADASQNAMAGEYKTLADGLLLICTLLGWNLLLDWAAFRFPRIRQLVEADKLLLIDRGQVMKQNLRKEFITEEDLLAKLRGYGIDDVRDVKKAYLESDGDITVVSRVASSRPAAASSARDKI